MEEMRLFSLEEANASVPHLSAAFERLERLRESISEAYREMRRAGFTLENEDEVEELDPSLVPEAVRPTAARFKQMVREVGHTVEGIHAMGCLVKDLRMGLVDFYSIVDGDPVYLCWQYGEEGVIFYHGLNDGFAGREPLPGHQRDDVVYN